MDYDGVIIVYVRTVHRNCLVAFFQCMLKQQKRLLFKKKYHTVGNVIYELNAACQRHSPCAACVLEPIFQRNSICKCVYIQATCSSDIV